MLFAGARLVHLCNLGVILVLVIAVYVPIARAGSGVDGALSFLESAGRDLGGICCVIRFWLAKSETVDNAACDSKVAVLETLMIDGDDDDGGGSGGVRPLGLERAPKLGHW